MSAYGSEDHAIDPTFYFLSSYGLPVNNDSSIGANNENATIHCFIPWGTQHIGPHRFVVNVSLVASVWICRNHTVFNALEPTYSSLLYAVQ